MSDLVNNTKTKAVNFNKKTTGFIPPKALSQFPGLAADRGSVEFYQAVQQVQTFFRMEADGMFGARTQNALTHFAAPYEDFLVIDGVRTPIDTKGLFFITDFTERASLDLHRFGNFSKRKKPVSRVVIHHGGYNVDHLAMVLSTSDRKVSTHIGLSINKDGKVEVAQYLDLKHTAWHCGKYNEGSIGIDFAMQPTEECAVRYGFPVIDNPSSIGPRKVLEFPDATINAMAQLISELHRVYGINLFPQEGADSRFDGEDRVSVVGHHHFATNGKFDVSYLWDRLCAALATANGAYTNV